MPLHDEDMDRRREKREAQRKKQQAEARRIRRTMILALLVLGLCIGGIVYLTRGQEPQEAPAVETTQATQPPEPTQSSPLRQAPTTEIHLVAAGDMNVTDSVISAGVAVNGYDFGGAFKDVASILSGGDLTVMNFEGNACGEPFGTVTTSAPSALLEELHDCGVDLLQMANSCTINNGMNGLSSTLQAIRNAGIEPIGAYASDAERNRGKGYTIAEAQGIRVAFVAFTKGLGGRGMPAGTDHLVNLLYTDYYSEYDVLDNDRIRSVMKAVAAENPDLTVVLLHWGSEYNDEITRAQTNLVASLQKQGADVILGTHSHTLQPIEFDPATGSFVAYSLGDFFGDADRAATNYSIILDLRIVKDNTTGNTRVMDYTYTPIYTVTRNECPDEKQRVVRIEKALEAYEGNYLDSVTTACKEAMEYALERIERRLHPELYQTEENK